MIFLHVTKYKPNMIVLHRRAGTIWKLCEQNSGSLETEQPCVLAQGRGSGCHPREILATYGQICILSQNDLQNYMYMQS